MTTTQKQCILAYFACLPPEGIDGIWGSRSAGATAQLQRKLDIPDDGIWGPETEAAVRKALSSPESTGAFWDHIRHWTREEFRCQCGGKYCNGFPVEPDQTLVELVDDVRAELGVPCHRSSGIRCTQNNANEGGVWNSKHLGGKALDFMAEGRSAQEVLAVVLKDPRTNYAYIIGNGPYVHVDVK